jgi:hypothetical protein
MILTDGKRFLSSTARVLLYSIFHVKQENATIEGLSKRLRMSSIFSRITIISGIS